MNEITEKTISMGLKLTSMSRLQKEDPAAFVKEEMKAQEPFQKHRAFNELVVAVHEGMCHTEEIAAECKLQIALTASIMSKMFQAGWLAGQQEIIDAEVSRINE